MIDMKNTTASDYKKVRKLALRIPCGRCEAQTGERCQYTRKDGTKAPFTSALHASRYEKAVRVLNAMKED